MSKKTKEKKLIWFFKINYSTGKFIHSSQTKKKGDQSVTLEKYKKSFQVLKVIQILENIPEIPYQDMSKAIAEYDSQITERQRIQEKIWNALFSEDITQLVSERNRLRNQSYTLFKQLREFYRSNQDLLEEKIRFFLKISQGKFSYLSFLFKKNLQSEFE